VFEKLPAFKLPEAIAAVNSGWSALRLLQRTQGKPAGPPRADYALPGTKKFHNYKTNRS